MGVMRFLVHPPDRFSADQKQLVYLAGPDLNPWRCRVNYSDGALQVDRNVPDSGNVFAPWMVTGKGTFMLSSASLMERQRPYQLAVELARGTVNQLRSQMFDWQQMGMQISPELVESINRTVASLALAVTSQDEIAVSSRHAEETLQQSLVCLDQLIDQFIDRSLAARRLTPGNDTRMFGPRLDAAVPAAGLDPEPQNLGNAAVVAFNWRDVEATEEHYDWSVYDAQIDWCQRHQLRVMGGPLLRLDDLGLPNWLCLWEGNFDHLMSFVGQYLEHCVKRYRGRVHVWQAAGRLGHSGLLQLNEEQRLRLAVVCLETIRRLDPNTPCILTFDQPWAEYMARQDVVLSPFDFADAIVRAGIGVNGLGLELNMGYAPAGCFARHALAVNRLIDHWTMLQLPLFVQVTAPSNETDDPKALGKSSPIPGAIAGGWSEAAQCDYGKRLLGLLLGKPTVHGVFWGALSDAAAHEFPHAGLYRATGQAKPLAGALQDLQRAAFSSGS